MLTKVLRTVLERKQALLEGTFMTPPSDWAEFQRRLGQFQELSLQEDELKAALKIDNEEDQP